MIADFADAKTEAVYHGKSPKGFPVELIPAARRKLDMLNRSRTVDDLRNPPGNHLESLRGDLEGYHSIRVNKQWRVVFLWDSGNARQVRIIDYH